MTQLDRVNRYLKMSAVSVTFTCTSPEYISSLSFSNHRTMLSIHFKTFIRCSLQGIRKAELPITRPPHTYCVWCPIGTSRDILNATHIYSDILLLLLLFGHLRGHVQFDLHRCNTSRLVPF